jgi:TatA/E family protein of Tat protein translocase
MSLGPAEILVILVVALLVFGPKKLPEIGRQVGTAMRELRKIQDNMKSELDGVLHPDLTPRIDNDPPIEETDHAPLPNPEIIDVPDVTDAGDDGFAGPSGSFT